MKKLINALLIIIMTMSTMLMPAMAKDNITVELDGKEIIFDVQPQIINDRTMVPLRAIFEALGATVEWDQATQTVTSIKDDTIIKLTINNHNMLVSGNSVTLDTPACIIEERTLVPVRAISEAFNLNVEWDGNTRTVIITSRNDVSKQKAFNALKNTIINKGIYFSEENWNAITLNFGEEKSLNIMAYEQDTQAISYTYMSVLDDGTKIGVKTSIFGKEMPPQGAIYMENNSLTASALYSYINEEWVVIRNTFPSNISNSVCLGLIKLIEERFAVAIEECSEVTIADLGIKRSSNNTNTDNNVPSELEYDNILTQVDTIKSYIAQGLYLEAMDLCDSTTKNYNISPADIEIINSLYNSAKTSYDEYVENKKKENKNKKVTDAQKQKIYAIVKNEAKSHLTAPSKAIWPNYNEHIYFYTEEGKLCIWGSLEAMNGYGGYGKASFMYTFNEDLSIDSGMFY